MKIDGKVALITGGASGIGRAVARRLAAEGASVVVADVDPDEGNETVRLIGEAGGTATFVNADVSTPEGIRLMFARAVNAYGGVDIVHNNAGLVAGEPAWPEMALERIKLMIDVNLAAVAMGTQEAIHHLRQRGGGVIVNTASMAALAPMVVDPIYGATKSAVVRFTETLAGLAASDDIRVNCVLPDLVDTPLLAKTGDGSEPAEWVKALLPRRTPLRAEDVADAVVALIDDDAAVAVARIVSPQPIEQAG